MGYESMSDEGRQVCTYIELHYRQKWLKENEKPLLPVELLLALKMQLPEGASEAVESYLAPPIGASMGYKIWKRFKWLLWVQNYLKNNPRDYLAFQKLELNFDDQSAGNVDWQLDYEEESPRAEVELNLNDKLLELNS